ncbi:MAG TPA: hypothetical protein ENK55_03350 [Actinobacteria bacterium]|nr:hypothetical protein [Actinomycetota bacterium]
MRRWIVILAVVAGCGGAPTPASTLPASSTSTTTSTTTTVPASSTTVPAPPTTVGDAAEDPWGIEIVDWEDDFFGVDDALASLLAADAVVAGTVVTLGDADGRWCCENPPLDLTDVEVVVGDLAVADGRFNGISFQHLVGRVAPGDRITLLTRSGVAALVFTDDGSLAHPVPPSFAAAIEAAAHRYAAAFGWDPDELRREHSVLEVFGAVWERYHDDWWGSPEQRAALVLSGFEGRPVTCSAADLGALLASWPPYPPAGRDLPPAVAATREALVDAATSCDYERIIELAGYRAPTEEDPVDVDAFWWNAMRDRDEFVEGDLTVGYLRELVLALTQTSVGIEVGPLPDPETGEYVETTLYVWPAAFILELVDEDGELRSFAELVDGGELARIAAVNGTTVERLVAAVEEFGGYAWFRTGIAEDGRWRFALSGD